MRKAWFGSDFSARPLGWALGWDWDFGKVAKALAHLRRDPKERTHVAVPATVSPGFARAKRHAILCLLLMVIGSIGLDQVTKIHAQTQLMRMSHETDPTIYVGQRFHLFTIGGSEDAVDGGTFFSLSTNYVRNLGAAWGALSNLPDGLRVPFFYLVTLVAVAVILAYIRATPPSHRLAIFALAMILSGALGNFIDRIRLGYVIDWIDARWNLLGWRYDFPNFNIADSAITVGVALLMVDMLVLDPARQRRQAAVSS